MRPVYDYNTGDEYRDQVYIGNSLMAKALVNEGMTQTDVFFTEFNGAETWYQRHKPVIHESNSTTTIGKKVYDNIV